MGLLLPTGQVRPVRQGQTVTSVHPVTQELALRQVMQVVHLSQPGQAVSVQLVLQDRRVTLEQLDLVQPQVDQVKQLLPTGLEKLEVQVDLVGLRLHRL